MSPRPLVGPRLKRVLALVPYIADHPGVSLEELASRFEVPIRDLEHDLELLWYCGLPPYTADRLIDLEIVDGHVSVRFAEYFARPLRLTAAEGLSLLAAGRALLAVPGADPDGALATALDKLARVVGAGAGLAVDVGGAPHLEALRRAAEAGEQVEIDYYSFGRDALTTRIVDPRSVFHAFGQWYVDAYCHQAEADRLFRVDRVGAVRPLGTHFERATGPDDRSDGQSDQSDQSDSSDDAVTGPVFRPRPEDTRVTVRLAPDADWVLEAYPTEGARQERDGSWRVVLVASERAWLERLLLRLGPAAEVLDPPEWRAAAAAAARRVLARYRGTPA